MFWTVGTQSTQGGLTNARGEHANFMQEAPGLGRIKLRSLLLQGNGAKNCAIVQPSCLAINNKKYILTLGKID